MFLDPVVHRFNDLFVFCFVFFFSLLPLFQPMIQSPSGMGGVRVGVAVVTSVPDSGMKLLIWTVSPGSGKGASLRLCMKG
jgi:hypothetical protein